MSSNNFFKKTGLLVLFIIFGLLIARYNVFADATQLRIEIVAPAPVCGNGVIEAGEQCEGEQLDGQTCASRGFNSGALSCKADCIFNTSSCISSGGRNGGGGGYTVPVTSVIFEGRAYPLSKVVILKDGQIAISTIAGPDARFEVNLSGLAMGNYTFAVYGEDNKGLKSTLFTFPAYITYGAATKVSGIFIAPTIAVDKSEVKRGDNIAIFGQSVPNSEVTISINSNEELFHKTNADSSGGYLLNFDTSVIETGQHSAKSKAALAGEISSFSEAVSFQVGEKTTSKETVKCGKADLNCDIHINLVDFSIAAYWYKRPLSVEFASIEKERLNGDKKVDLVDFSIMAYYWTG